MYNDRSPIRRGIVDTGAMDALRRGLTECPDWTHAQSLALMELDDKVRTIHP